MRIATSNGATASGHLMPASSCDASMIAAGVDTLYHDKDERPGAKFATADLIGIPWHILVGPKGLAEGKVELKCRADGSREMLTPADAVARFVG